MDHCSGGSIHSLLNRFDVFEEELIKKYIRQILNGLEYLHSKNMIHLNLNPNNVLVDSSGKIKISDYIEFNIITKFNSERIIKIVTNNYKSNFLN